MEVQRMQASARYFQSFFRKIGWSAHPEGGYCGRKDYGPDQPARGMLGIRPVLMPAAAAALNPASQRPMAWQTIDFIEKSVIVWYRSKKKLNFFQKNTCKIEKMEIR